ncbi:hypothetical protein HYPSUDRAFT_199729 [Hypholoma sublateritium FD-334 SS-4]|uniref:Uncharacterized protein n=1 Tax=Hypholoma sublateritium (strain FD-334 SS-4) TaxID=945553 RepID=A0A0D2PAJ7_HYPSF|nr:hypothetical protein HYPSUDRAFT_199729 [Hypholoma sublateritium FD-334 SS-4]
MARGRASQPVWAPPPHLRLSRLRKRHHGVCGSFGARVDVVLCRPTFPQPSRLRPQYRPPSNLRHRWHSSPGAFRTAAQPHPNGARPSPSRLHEHRSSPRRSSSTTRRCFRRLTAQQHRDGRLALRTPTTRPRRLREPRCSLRRRSLPPTPPTFKNCATTRAGPPHAPSLASRLSGIPKRRQGACGSFDALVGVLLCYPAPPQPKPTAVTPARASTLACPSETHTDRRSARTRCVSAPRCSPTSLEGSQRVRRHDRELGRRCANGLHRAPPTRDLRPHDPPRPLQANTLVLGLSEATNTPLHLRSAAWARGGLQSTTRREVIAGCITRAGVPTTAALPYRPRRVHMSCKARAGAVPCRSRRSICLDPDCASCVGAVSPAPHRPSPQRRHCSTPPRPSGTQLAYRIAVAPLAVSPLRYTKSTSPPLQHGPDAELSSSTPQPLRFAQPTTVTRFMIVITILQEACKAKHHLKLSKWAYIALGKISHDLPAQGAYLAIMSTPHGSRREAISHLYSNSSTQGEFLGVLSFTLDRRNPTFTPADDCCGRAANHIGRQYITLKDRLLEVGRWPVSKK